MRRMRFCPARYSVVLAAGCCVLTNLCVALATTLRDLSLDEMVAASDEIVVGKCEQTECVWIGKKIYTVATVSVSQAPKGSIASGNKIVIHTLGGRVTSPLPVEMYVEGSTQMQVGEEMVLFLEKYGEKKQYRRTVGMSQGKITVSVAGKTGMKMVNYGQPDKNVKQVDAQGRAVEPSSEALMKTAGKSTLKGFLDSIHTSKTEQEEKKAKADAEKSWQGVK